MSKAVHYVFNTYSTCIHDLQIYGPLSLLWFGP